MEKAQDDEEYQKKVINLLNKTGNRPFNMKTVTYEEMIAIPNDESDLIPVPVYINMEKKIRVDTMITQSDIRNKALRFIFLGKSAEAEDLIFKMARENKWDKSFQFDLLMCFWFSIHMGNKYLVNKIMIFDVYLRQLVTLAIMNKNEKPRGWKKKTEGPKIKNISKHI